MTSTFLLFTRPLRRSLVCCAGLLLDRLNLFTLRSLSKVLGSLDPVWWDHISPTYCLLCDHIVLLKFTPLVLLLRGVSITRRSILVVLELLHPEAHDVLHFVQHLQVDVLI